MPVTQETTLPAHTIQLGASGGVTYSPFQVTDVLSGSPSISYLASPAFTLRGSWAPLDRLELGFSSTGLGATFRAGARHRDEGVFSLGVSGFGVSNVDGFIVLPLVSAGWRHWFSNQASVLAWVGGGATLSKRYSFYSISGGGLFSVTFRELISINIGLSGKSWLGWALTSFTIGGGHGGLRALPLIQVHVTPVWSIDFTAEVTLYPVDSKVQTGQTYLAGFTATW